jgi:hypothetical protein
MIAPMSPIWLAKARHERLLRRGPRLRRRAVEHHVEPAGDLFGLARVFDLDHKERDLVAPVGAGLQRLVQVLLVQEELRAIRGAFR